MKAHVNGTDIAYRLDGPEAAPVVVLSHSIATTMAMWRGQVPALTAQFRVLRYDMRGHGESAAPAGAYDFELLAADVIGLLDHLKIDRAAFVGISIGGMVGQALGVKHGHRLRGLVLSNTTSDPPPPEMWDQRIADAEKGGMQTQVSSTLGRWFTEPFRNANPAIMDWIAAMICNTPVNGFAGCGRAIQGLGFADQLCTITVPTLIMTGDQDPGTTAAMAKTLNERIPRSRTSIIEGAAHLSAIEKEMDFNAQLLAFLPLLPRSP